MSTESHSSIEGVQEPRRICGSIKLVESRIFLVAYQYLLSQCLGIKDFPLVYRTLIVFELDFVTEPCLIAF